ncbi:hypothetical protein [Hafnia alvei]|uniref:hypothetical protein n=1 Tax=Hafnia alvei TaxID=569 RepID=UPI000B04F29E|nr:hypothetical protein [Hafnia alvei]MDU7483683.1 hypothetical protein [Hafnia alvei]MDU7757562.1 hypothetical protein [Staphylococcus epidermidis]TBL89836.1 hypothetical protein EYY88_02130 [Hafnia alvei]
MCARDPSKNTSYGQLDSTDLVRHFINLFPYPSCIRDSFGNFVLFNDWFARSFLPNQTKPADWLSSLSTNLSLKILSTEINSFSDQNCLNTIEGISLGNSHWDLNFNLLINESNPLCLWTFFYHKSSPWSNRNIITTNYHYELIKEFKSSSTELQWKVYVLHVFGISHEIISRVFSLHRGTSRNIVSHIHKHFQVGTKDELIVIMYESGLAVNLLNEVERIIISYKNGCI